MTDRAARIQALEKAVKERILILDGAMGTQIQELKLTEEDFRGERLKDWPKDLKGNNDILALTQPDRLAALHRAYFEAGADFAETNTFSATTIAQADYAAESLAREINYESARIARAVADAVTAETGRQRWVIGVLGPTNRTASISPDVNDPGARNVDFDELRAAYRESIDALIEGGVDCLMVETIFDTLNAKAALFAIDEAFEDLGETLPIFISGTITDKSGRTLSGQTAEAFWNSVRHAKPFAIGLNCALGAKDMRPFMAELSRIADVHVSAHPNAGLPNAYGDYDETPEQMAGELGAWMKDGLLDIVGGCCGTTPAHIAALRKAADEGRLRKKPKAKAVMRLSGLEPLTVG